MEENIIADKSNFEKTFGIDENKLDFTTPLMFAKSLQPFVSKLSDDEVEVLAQFVEMYLRGCMMGRGISIPVLKPKTNPPYSCPLGAYGESHKCSYPNCGCQWFL